MKFRNSIVRPEDAHNHVVVSFPVDANGPKGSKTGSDLFHMIDTRPGTRKGIFIRGPRTVKTESGKRWVSLFSIDAKIPLSAEDINDLMSNPSESYTCRELLAKALSAEVLEGIPDSRGRISMHVGNVGTVMDVEIPKDIPKFMDVMDILIGYLVSSIAKVGRASGEDICLVVTVAGIPSPAFEFRYEDWYGGQWTNPLDPSVSSPKARDPLASLAIGCHEGACNVRGIIRSLAECSSRDGFDPQSPEARYIIGHLSFLVGNEAGPPDAVFQELKEKHKL